MSAEMQAAPSHESGRTTDFRLGETMQLVERYPVFWLALVLLAGGKLGLSLPYAFPWVPYLCFALCVLCFGFALPWRRVLRSDKFPGSSQSIVLGTVVGCFFAGIYAGSRLPPPRQDSLSATATRQSQPIAVRAVIDSAAVWSPNPNYRERDAQSQPWRTQWRLQCEQVLDRQQWQPIQAGCLLTVEGRVDEFLPGDVIEVYGNYRKIYEPTNPGAFDFAQHSQREGRFVMLTADSVSQLERIDVRYDHPLQRLRGWAVRSVDRSLYQWVSHQQAPLAAALVFGQRQQVDWEHQQELMATGTLHMLAISGMHVEIVAGGILILCWLFRVTDNVRLMSLIAVCLLYAGLADGKPPVLRAAVLVMAFEVARHCGRKARLVNLLSLAAIVLFLLRASNLDNVGVHLSFLAVAAIGVFVLDRTISPIAAKSPVDSLLEEVRGPVARILQMVYRWFASMLCLSFWVWLITCPMVWYHFHVIAPIAVPLNVLVAIPLGISLLSGLIAGLFGWITPVGLVAGAVCGSGLAAIHGLVSFGKQILGGHYWLPAPSVAWICLFYGTVALWLLAFRRKHRPLLGVLLSGFVMLSVAAYGLGPRGTFQPYSPMLSSGSEIRMPEEHSGGLVITFLDVGHGTSVIIELPNGKVWLYDAGHLGSADRSHQEIAAALWQLNTAGIDTLILSHADADHYNATQGLVERFGVGRVVSTERFWASEDSAVRELNAELQARRIECASWAAGAEGIECGALWKILHPSSSITAESDNASSLCLLIEYQGRRVLLPGDLDGSGLMQLLELPERPCHVLMAPHHGSLTHDPAELLQWCHPELVVISGNHRAASPAVVEKYAPATRQLAITFRDGAIQYRIDPSGEASSWHFRSGQWRELP